MAFPWADKWAADASEATGLPPDLLKIAFTLVMSYPLSSLMKRLPDDAKNLKILYIISVSVFYMVGVFSLYGGAATLLFSSMGTFFITYWRSPYMPWANFAFVMTHLFINHLRSQFFPVTFDPNVIDITGAQMVLCMKLSSFGWNVYDGWQIEEGKKLSEFQTERAVRKHPSVIDFLAFVFYFPSILTGPSYDYMEFHNWLDLSLFKELENDPDPKRAARRKRHKIPRSGIAASKKLAWGIFWIVLWTQVDARISTAYAYSDNFTKEHNIFGRIVYLYMLGFMYRLKYYGAWSIAEGACILSGLGFNGVDPKTGKYKWDRVQNVDPWGFETGQNTKALLEAWNQNTNVWLRNYVYLRVVPKGQKPGFRATLFTFVVSAFWHGTRPGYYLTFVTAAMYQSVGKFFRRYLRPFFMQPDGKTGGPYKLYYDIVCWIVTQAAFGYATQSFMILDFWLSLKCWKNSWFLFHVGLAIIFAIASPYKSWAIPKIKKKQAGAVSDKKDPKEGAKVVADKDTVKTK